MEKRQIRDPRMQRRPLLFSATAVLASAAISPSSPATMAARYCSPDIAVNERVITVLSFVAGGSPRVLLAI